MKRIFVQMVSYRDPECHHTIADLFARAAHPERISVGVCWQYDPQEDAAFLGVPYPRRDQVRMVHFHWQDAQGAGWARNQAQGLWQGEEYVLQIQAHHRFEQGWDDTLIALLEGLPEKSLLTAWLPNYVPPDAREQLGDQLPVSIINRVEDDTQIVHMTRRNLSRASLTAPFPTGLWVGNFLFCRAGAIQEVPSDPHLYFWGEELNYSARLWTHGYDFYHLNRVVAYHYWDREEVKGEAHYRDHFEARNARSRARNRHVLGIELSDDPAALVEIDKYGMGNARILVDYFAYIGVDVQRGLVSAGARQGKVGAKQPSIFVAIASYRDPELAPTIASLMDNAAYPERVHICICQQLRPDGDEDCMFTPPSNVKMVEVPAHESGGANWARVQALSLYAGEEFILQVDSHMRFVPGWDEILLEMHARCPSPRSVISGYLPNYTPPDRLEPSPGHILRLCVRKLGEADDPQLVHLTGRFVPLASKQGGLYPSPFVAANFMFGPAEVWQQVPPDPHLYFHGDEINTSARLWTHDIDIIQPDCVVAYHYWARTDQLSKHRYRRTNLEPAQISRMRNQHLLGVEKTANSNALAHLDRYPLGTARSLQDFWRFAGIDLVEKTVTDAALTGLWKLRDD